MALSEEFKQIGYDITGAAIDVRNNSGRCLREVCYRKALAWELQQSGYDRIMAMNTLGLGGSLGFDIINRNK